MAHPAPGVVSAEVVPDAFDVRTPPSSAGSLLDDSLLGALGSTPPNSPSPRAMFNSPGDLSSPSSSALRDSKSRNATYRPEYSKKRPKESYTLAEKFDGVHRWIAGTLIGSLLLGGGFLAKSLRRNVYRSVGRNVHDSSTDDSGAEFGWGAGASSSSNWQVLEVPGILRVELPGVAQEKRQYEGSIEHVLYECESSSGHRFMAGYSRGAFQRSPSSREARFVMTALCDQLVEKFRFASGCREVARRDVFAGSNQGIEVVFDLDGQGQAIRRFYVAGTSVYTVGGVGAGDFSSDPDLDHVFDSFLILGDGQFNAASPGVLPAPGSLPPGGAPGPIPGMPGGYMPPGLPGGYSPPGVPGGYSPPTAVPGIPGGAPVVPPGGPGSVPEAPPALPPGASSPGVIIIPGR